MVVRSNMFDFQSLLEVFHPCNIDHRQVVDPIYSQYENKLVVIQMIDNVEWKINYRSDHQEQSEYNPNSLLCREHFHI